ncbi:MAG: hypothetical protein ACR2NH_06735 [Solirubrobacteraceae bacterium]
MEEARAETTDSDNLPVVAAEVRAIEPARPAASPAVQAAAVGAASFVAGAATFAVVKRAKNRGLPLRRKRRARKQLGEVVSSRSFLVDVHLLNRD